MVSCFFLYIIYWNTTKTFYPLRNKAFILHHVFVLSLSPVANWSVRLGNRTETWMSENLNRYRVTLDWQIIFVIVVINYLFFMKETRWKWNQNKNHEEKHRQSWILCVLICCLFFNQLSIRKKSWWKLWQQLLIN